MHSMQLALNRNRKRGTVLLACIVLILTIIVMGIVFLIVVRACKRIPPRTPPKDDDEDAQMDYTIDATPMSALPSDFTNVYRFVLQRSTNGTDFDDIAEAPYSRESITFGGTTNWTQIGIFRFKAIKVK